MLNLLRMEGGLIRLKNMNHILHLIKINHKTKIIILSNS